MTFERVRLRKRASLARSASSARLRRDVPEHSLNADDVAVRVVDGRLEHLHINGFAVGLAVLFHVLENPPRRNDPRVVPAIFLREVPRKQVVVGLALELLPGEADFVEIVLIRVDQPPLEVLAEHVQRQALDQRPVAGLRVPQIVVRPLATHRIAHGMLEDARLEVVANQVILGPLLERFDRGVLVREVRQGHHGDARSLLRELGPAWPRRRFAARRRSAPHRSVRPTDRELPARLSPPIPRRN